MKLVLEYHNTPMVWRAYDEETADGAPDSGELARMHGEGSSREAAVVDLLEKMDEYWTRRFSNSPYRWIPVDERKPDCTIEDAFGHTSVELAFRLEGFRDSVTGVAIKMAGDHYAWRHPHSGFNVTHWMPLPEAPK